ncbi:MAG: ABC transporter substrate-binding protein [Tenacibaculum sp.]
MFLFFVFLLLVLTCKKKINHFSDEDVFKYNEHTNISSLDPAFAKDQSDIWAVNQIFNGLVQLDERLQVQPDIAKKWIISKDGKTYKFHLRKDVFFHQHKLFGPTKTRAVKASDFVYSFKRLLNAKVASPGGWILQKVASFKAVTDTVLTIELKQAFPPFLGLLSTKYCSVVPKEAVNYFKDTFRSNPIGTGPFYCKLWIENTKLVLRKNPLYFEKDDKGNSLPYLQAVAINFLPDKQSEFLQFIQGDIDFIKGLDASYKDDIININGSLKEKYKTRINMLTSAYLNTEYLGFYLDEKNTSPTHSKLIRQAINYGFDRKKMITYLRNGIGTPATSGFIPKGLPSFAQLKGYTYHPEKAKKLIATYKQSSKKQVVQISIATNSNYLDICEYIQRELEKIGITTKIELMPPAILRQGKATGILPIFRASWIADYPDAENYLSLFYSKNFAPQGPNYTHFRNVEFDRLYELAIKEIDIKKRQLLYQKMDSIIIEQAPVVPLYYDQVIRFVQKNVSGLGINPIDMLSLKRVKKSKS